MTMVILLWDKLTRGISDMQVEMSRQGWIT